MRSLESETLSEQLAQLEQIDPHLRSLAVGTLTRAVMSRRDEALATGIDVDRVSAAAFGIGLTLATPTIAPVP